MNDIWKGQSANYITEPEQPKAQIIFKIEEAQLPTTFDDLYTPLPNRVEFRKIIVNVLNSIKGKQRAKQEFNIKTQVARRGSFDEDEIKEERSRKRPKFERWQDYLQLDENVAVVSDCFWFVLCKYFREIEQPTQVDMLNEVEQQFLKRISKNYINLFLQIEAMDEEQFGKDDSKKEVKKSNNKDTQEFFKTYFDTLAQSVFYALFYSFPLSRTKFDDNLKKYLIDEFSQLFAGVHISNVKEYIPYWNLDLGAGNIFKMKHNDPKQPKNGGQLPPIQFSRTTAKARNKRSFLPIKFSPIVEIYLKNNKYATRNQIQGFKMKFTEMDQNQDEMEHKFDRYVALADEILQTSKEMKRDNYIRKRDMKKEIKEIKQETVNHHKRLEKRKAEELERGAHEYANYLVSILNTGITVANLGVSKQK